MIPMAVPVVVASREMEEMGVMEVGVGEEFMVVEVMETKKEVGEEEEV